MSLQGLRLTKHEAAGNDFLVVLEGPRSGLSDVWVRHLLDRRRGVGADGLVEARLAVKATRDVEGRLEVEAALGASPPPVGAALGASPPPVGAALDASPPPIEATMRLHNADGSVAETSGNGLRCLAQAAALALGCSSVELSVRTDAGWRQVGYEADDTPGTVSGQAWAVMGPVELEADAMALVADLLPSARRAVMARVGNPHVVVLLDQPLTAGVLEAAGRELQARLHGGANLELVRVGDDGVLEMSVFERGVGPTLACGSGTCAAAAAAAAWGLLRRGAEGPERRALGPRLANAEAPEPLALDPRGRVAEGPTPLASSAARRGIDDPDAFEVEVRNPGGSLSVRLARHGEGQFEACLAGSVHFVAWVEVPDAVLESAGFVPRRSEDCP
jgi:diaminopimelate epimerase